MASSKPYFEWKDFLGVAEYLHEPLKVHPPQPEAVQRTIIGRAYYAAYWGARDYIAHVDREALTPASGGGLHQAVHSHFQQSTNAARRELGGMLETLKTARGRADYTPWPISTYQVVLAIHLARSILDALKRPLPKQ